MAKIQIKTKKQLRAVKNEIAKKKSTTMAKIVVDRNGTHFELTKAISNSLDIEMKSAFAMDFNTQVVVDQFTDTIVGVEFRASGNKEQKDEILEKSKLFRFTAIKFDGAKSDVISLMKVKGKTVGYSFLYKRKVNVDLKKLQKNGYSLYVAGAYSASEARKNATTLYKCERSSEVAEKLNELSYGAFDILLGNEMTLEESQKIAARMGQWKTGMTHTEDCNMVAAFFMGKWHVDNTEHADGKAFARDVKVAEILSNEKYEVSRNAVEGILIQNRPFSVCKTEAKVTNAGYIKNKVLFDAGGTGKVVWINREEITPEIQDEFNKLFIKGETSSFRGKVVIVKPKDIEADLRNIDYYTDLNGLKASYDLSKDSGFNILAIDKPLKDGTVNTNMQQLETMAMADPEATKEILKDIAANYNKKLMYGALKPVATVPSIKDIEQLYTAGIVKNIAPDFALQNQKIFGTIADQSMQAMVKAVNGLNYKVPGQSRILQMDFAADFGTRIMPVGYCHAPGIKDRLIIATRAPKQYTGEFLILINLTRKEVMDLIKENDKLTPAQKKAVMREYKFLSESAVVIGAYEEYKEATGGADVDGDVLSVMTYRKFSQLIKKAIKSGKINSTAIKVESKKVAQERDMKFSLQTIHTAFVKLITNGNLTIGEVTYMNNYLLGLLYDLLAGRTEAALEFFKFAGNNGDGEGEYAPVPRKYDKDLRMNIVDVSFDLMEDAVVMVKEMELTPANMIQALDDLNAIFMMLQMETIDAAKKGTMVPVPYQGMLNKFQQASKTKIDIDLGIRERDDIDENYKVSGGINYLVETRSGWAQDGVDRNGQPIMRYFHQDLFHEIRLDIARDIMRIARALRKKWKNARFDDKISQLFITAKDQAGKKMVRDLIELKKIYNSINAGIRQDETEEPYYKVYMEALTNTVRLITSHMTDVERAELAEAISVPTSDHGSKYSSFAMSTLKEEYLKMVTENFADIDVAGERIMQHKNTEEGDVLEFRFGVANDEETGKFAATKGDINGEFTIKKINDKFYAVQNIVDLIPAVELNDKIVFRIAGENLDKVKDALLKAEHVQLSIVFGEGNLVIADGKTVGKFITVPGKSELNELYDGRTGVIKNVMVVEETLNDMVTKKKVLVAVMETDESLAPEEVIEDEDIFGDDAF